MSHDISESRVVEWAELVGDSVPEDAERDERSGFAGESFRLRPPSERPD
mgnify:FL=1